MSINEYTPQQAFEVLMTHLRKRDEQLATHIQAVVDAGKDVDETQQVGKRRKRSRSYRRTVPYDYEEALQAALDALQAYFVEQPLFIASSAKNMAATELGNTQPSRTRWQAVEGHWDEVVSKSVNERKRIEIELRTETQISERNEEMFELQEIDVTQIEEQQKNVAQLRNLLDLRIDHGNSQ
ncbi:MAG: hypothetical protein ABSG96_24330 [Terracidiphilus sp.]|jgi:hypothetical protein